MRPYTLTCVEQLPSGYWRVDAQYGRFVLTCRTAVWMKDPRPGRTVVVRIPDFYAARKAQLVGHEIHQANLERERRTREMRQNGDANAHHFDRRFAAGNGVLKLLDLLERDKRPLLTRQEVEARGGKVMEFRGALWAFERGRWTGRVHGDETAGLGGDAQGAEAAASSAGRGPDAAQGVGAEAKAAGAADQGAAAGKTGRPDAGAR